MKLLLDNLKQNDKYSKIIDLVLNDNKLNGFEENVKNVKKENKKASNISVTGLNDVAKAASVAIVTKKTKKSSVVVCSNVSQANKLLQDLKFFSDIETIYLPARAINYYDVEAESKEIANQRMYAISKILEDDLKIVVTTIDALLVKMNENELYKSEDFKLSLDDEINLDTFVKDIVKLGYERFETVEGKGQFAVRGGIIDIFTTSGDVPHRIELFGNTVDSIRSFDITNQRSIESVENIFVSRVLETYIDSEKQDSVAQTLEKLCDSDKISKELKRVIYEDIEKIKYRKSNNLFDKYFALFVEKSQNILEYFQNYTVYFNEPVKCYEKSQNIIYENVETLKILSDREYIYLPYANNYITFEELMASFKNKSNIYLEHIVFDKDIHKGREQIKIDTTEKLFYKNSIQLLLSDITNAKSNFVLLVFPTKSRVEQMKNYLIENGINVEYIENIYEDLKSESENKNKVYIKTGILSTGFESKDLDFLVIAEPVTGLRQEKIQRARKNENVKQINTYEDLQEGDYVVHESQGIGIYRGINTIEIRGIIKDYIKIEYGKKGMLYIPINQLDSLTKFMCDEDTKPEINVLGTSSWQKTKEKVKKHVKEIAKELMILYAKRENIKGYSFPKDTPWQEEFEDSFEYELTRDQKVAVEEIKEDMESDKPMDRLLCGDVGYGKTEVALRAAFKAALNSKQVAYLVPTTVLALQQYKTFKKRMESFGIRVEMLSRIKTKKQQNEILKDLIDGKIDIVVGTHRLLSKDIFFKDLGLLIIDEEHRFGVKAKEVIKQLKSTVDVLSMTATPIPRTLHMSMIGVRSMSTLFEPPMERLPVHTYVLEYDENIIKEAIEKELLRDGQIFYINNRVNNIEEIVHKVRSLVPEAKISYAHGQMDPRQVEKVMIDFMEHKLDVIVCTTILESGIDIQNANTIIIENADRLGLAQLYQIRGRVGRSSRLSYAYITYKKNKGLSEISEKRLKAIRDFTEFGSGFKIALRDLEIRGAGNLLGSEQHGHMQKVGYDMYLALLEKAIKEEKDGIDTDGKKEVEQDIKIELNVSAYISDEYISNSIQKISMYQKISDIKTKEETIEIIAELLDRYGEIPKEVENLIKIVEIRNEARSMGITRIYQKENFLIFEPSNLKYRLTNLKNSDILINVQTEIKKIKEMLEEKGYN